MNDIVHGELEQIAREVFDDNRLVLTDTTTPGDVPSWDSLAHVTFMYSIERQFGVQFSEEEFIGFENISGLKDILSQKLNGNGPA